MAASKVGEGQVFGSIPSCAPLRTHSSTNWWPTLIGSHPGRTKVLTPNEDDRSFRATAGLRVERGWGEDNVENTRRFTLCCIHQPVLSHT